MEQPEPMEPTSPAETSWGTPGSRACPATWVSPACPVILVSPASSATSCSQNCPAMSVSPACSTTSGSRAYPATPVSSACSAIPRSRTCPATPVSPACSATPGPRASPATLCSRASPATLCSRASPATLCSRASPDTLCSPASPDTLGSPVSPATLGSPASPATLCSRASPDTLGSPASPDTLGSPAFSVTSAAQAPPTFPSSSLLYSHVSRIIASRKEKAGIWFPHLGLIEKTPESTTTAMMKQPFLPESKRKVEEWLPSRYQLRQQQASRNYFPFSMHDNRRGLEFCGQGLDERLGRKKLDQVQLHFQSTNFNRWASGYVPTLDDNISTYQASYMAKPRAKGRLFPLYPKHHSDRWDDPVIWGGRPL